MRFERMQTRIASPIAANPATPPTAPPTIGPTFDLFSVAVIAPTAPSSVLMVVLGFNGAVAEDSELLNATVTVVVLSPPPFVSSLPS